MSTNVLLLTFFRDSDSENNTAGILFYAFITCSLKKFDLTVVPPQPTVTRTPVQVIAWCSSAFSVVCESYLL